MEDNDGIVRLRDAMERTADELPPLPDLAPLAVCEGRGRRTRARFTAGAVVCGVLAAGTLGVTVLLHRPAADVAGLPPRTAAETLRERSAEHQRKAAALFDELLPAKVTDVSPGPRGVATYELTVHGETFPLVFSVRPAAPAELLHCATRAEDAPSCEEDTRLRTGLMKETALQATLRYQYRKSRVELTVYAGFMGKTPVPVSGRDLSVVTADPRFLELVRAADADPLETPAPLDPSEEPLNPFVRFGVSLEKAQRAR
ncbi:hypothetical protein ACFVJI_16515 [Streptomyces sp. NPDC127584]|uniref:hypothetical protein n=1 Tax=Streptomyces sp. NPDC127584 TaxID=3345403 RepID=UPI00363B4329